jgi:hypothetical protein
VANEGGEAFQRLAETPHTAIDKSFADSAQLSFAHGKSLSQSHRGTEIEVPASEMSFVYQFGFFRVTPRDRQSTKRRYRCEVSVRAKERARTRRYERSAAHRRCAASLYPVHNRDGLPLNPG